MTIGGGGSIGGSKQTTSSVIYTLWAGLGRRLRRVLIACAVALILLLPLWFYSFDSSFSSSPTRLLEAITDHDSSSKGSYADFEAWKAVGARIITEDMIDGSSLVQSSYVLDKDDKEEDLFQVVIKNLYVVPDRHNHSWLLHAFTNPTPGVPETTVVLIPTGLLFDSFHHEEDIVLSPVSSTKLYIHRHVKPKRSVSTGTKVTGTHFMFHASSNSNCGGGGGGGGFAHKDQCSSPSSSSKWMMTLMTSVAISQSRDIDGALVLEDGDSSNKLHILQKSMLESSHYPPLPVKSLSLGITAGPMIIETAYVGLNLPVNPYSDDIDEDVELMQRVARLGRADDVRLIRNRLLSTHASSSSSAGGGWKKFLKPSWGEHTTCIFTGGSGGGGAANIGKVLKSHIDGNPAPVDVQELLLSSTSGKPLNLPTCGAIVTTDAMSSDFAAVLGILQGTGSVIIDVLTHSSFPNSHIKSRILAASHVSHLSHTIKLNSQGLPTPKSQRALNRLVIHTRAWMDESNPVKYMMFMPWEQLNNQLIALRCSCAVAEILNRTLVLPKIGYRPPLPPNGGGGERHQWDFSFEIYEMEWQPFETYFDLNTVMASLPCSTITFDQYTSLNTGDAKNLDDVLFNPVAHATSTKQLQEYYKDTLGLSYRTIQKAPNKLAQLTRQQVLDIWGKYPSKTLALGAAFWLYGFDRVQPYPLVEYVDYMDHPTYRAISMGLRPSERIQRVASKAWQKLKQLGNPGGGTGSGNAAGFVVGVHVRRGDYWNKCKRIKDVKLQKKCFPSNEDIRKSIDLLVEEHRGGDDDDEPVTVYVATNDQSVEKEFDREFGEKYKLFYFGDLVADKEDLDPVETALVDMEICSQVDAFVGSFYTSFARTIFERREYLGLPYSSF